ncbi:MAG: argininosuccinate lyase [Eubacteriales bacterium]|nr:argininosuccinate lyase [Eubacteriales bacterium]
MALWAGRFQKEIAKETNDFNSSLPFDCRMYEQDIRGSRAHVTMLAHIGVLTTAERDVILAGLDGILDDIASGHLHFDNDAEDIHSFVENELTQRVGEVGKKLHTGRSRNDQVAVDIRLYLRDEIDNLSVALRRLLTVLTNRAEEEAETVVCGFTHLQKAQPIIFGHHLMAYAEMFYRDMDRLSDCRRRLNVNPLGSAALAGTTYPLDRQLTSALLGFSEPTGNSLDGVSDRDFCLELASTVSIAMMHLSRFSEEIILWASMDYGYITLDDAYATGSSIMPQKKNPDIAELVRGKTGRVYGDMVALFTMMKGLPLAYNKDMQEDKEAVFDLCDTLSGCLAAFTPMLETMRINREVMRNGVRSGFVNATDCADYLVSKGLPFRDAYKIIGTLVGECTNSGRTLEELTLDELRAVSPAFDDDVDEALDIDNCVARRNCEGATSPDSVRRQVASMRLRLTDSEE